MKPTPNIKPLSPRKAVEHPNYDGALLQAAAHFVSEVPADIDGRGLVSLLSFGTAEQIKEAGVLLWDRVPHARDAANRIDALARHMLAINAYFTAKASEPSGAAGGPAPAPAPEAATPAPCPLTEAMKRAGVPLPPAEVIAAIKQATGLKPGDRVEVLTGDLPPEDEAHPALKGLLAALGGAMQDDDHGLPMECFIALQMKLPGIRVVQRKVISCPTLPVPVAQAILDMALAKGEDLGLM